MIDPRKPDFADSPASPSRSRFGYRPGGNALPVVSVITPFFNERPETFQQTARAMAQQSLVAYEWIIIDDGSTPEAAGLLEAVRSDPRVVILRHPTSRGPGAARNTGVRQARAELLFFLDADDLVEPTALEKLAWVLATEPAYAFVKGYSVGFGAKQYLWNSGFAEAPPTLLEENSLTITSLIRKRVFEAVGGFDETNRSGFEDWDFWLRCAAAGHWGGTVPEHLDWYRRRDDHGERWSNWDQGARQAAFVAQAKEKYGAVASNFPWPKPRFPAPYDSVGPVPFANPIAKSGQRLLLILPWLKLGGADKFNFRMLEQLVARGWEVTVATTLDADHDWMAEFTRISPDVFALGRFVAPQDRATFLRYLIESRSPDVVAISNSEFGYLVQPYLRAACPDPVYIDYCHMEEDYWKNGGYPRYAVGLQSSLDLNIVSSQHLKGWMVARGADADRIEVCNTNEDPQEWTPREADRLRVRSEYGIPTDQLVILFAGRLCSQKQPPVLAGTLQALHERGLRFTAIIAGDGEDRPYLERALGGLEGKVRMLGAVPNQQMKALMSASDVFFLPSLWEGIALSIFEAMSMGLAIVGANVGGQRELVTPECGWLLPRADVATEIAAYAQVLEGLIADPTRARAMGAQGRGRIESSFQLGHMGQRFTELLARAARLKVEAPRVALPLPLATEIAARGAEYIRMQALADTYWHKQHAHVPDDPNEVRSELERIQRSRSYLLVERLKDTVPYRLAARVRWGEDWNGADPYENPTVLLARIKASRSFRLIQALKRTAPYEWYSARKERG